MHNFMCNAHTQDRCINQAVTCNTSSQNSAIQFITFLTVVVLFVSLVNMPTARY